MGKDLLDSLQDRELNVLTSIVEAYIEFGEPIGSRYLSKLDGIKYSPATLRNIMTDLTELGLLGQPHVSAGRTPTDKGLRLYIDYKFRQRSSKSPNIKLLQDYLPMEQLELEDLFRYTVNYTSVMTGMVAMLTTPCPSNSVFRRLEFITINDNRVLIVVITKTGMVIHKTVDTREKMDSSQLHEIASYMNETYSNKLLKDVRDMLVENMGAHLEQNEYISKWVRLCKKAFTVRDHGRLVSAGFSNMASQHKFEEKDSLSLLNFMTDNQDEFVHLIDQSMGNENRIQIMIGSESLIDSLNNFSIVYHPYGNEGNILGNLGVIGPKHIDYMKMTKIVEDTARQLTKELTDQHT